MTQRAEKVQNFLDEIQAVCIKHKLILIAANMDGYMQVYDMWGDDWHWSSTDIQNAQDKTMKPDEVANDEAR